jgi:glyoxylase-like metal-dependent hydrolase (beta-lactamase superfamily II)
MTKSGKAAQQMSAPMEPEGLLAVKMSRRSFGRLLGMQAAMASAVPLAGCLGGNDSGPSQAQGSGDQPLTRGAFVATISDYFEWVHSSEYVDAYKSVQPTFADVALGTTPNAKAIEMALEESVISNARGYFYPETLVTREDAADIYVKAFGIPLSASNALSGFTDATSISSGNRDSVNAMVAAGFMRGISATLFSPSGTLTGNEAKAILAAITAVRVAPPQVMCKPGTTAPRRYVTISTPTDGATIYYTYTSDGTEPADPTVAGTEYNFRNNGVLQFVNPLSSTTDFRKYRLKAVAKMSGMATSAIREFTWNIVRPQAGGFQAKLVHAGTSTSPTVWKINNPSEYYQAHVFYIEGSSRGIVFDAGEYGYQKANLKSFIDTIATKPYDLVLGHHHPDHSEQVSNFTSAGIKFYITAIEKAALLTGRADQIAAANASVEIKDGDVLDLGNVQVTAYQQPGHTNGLLTLLINQTGWVYGSDMWGCNRAYTADTTQYNGVKVDLFLSLAQQLVANYRKSSATGLITEVTNAHQEVPVGMVCVNNFLKCFQQLIDGGDAASAPSIRGGIAGNPTSPGTRNSRMSMVGDMWRDKNWMAVGNSLGSGLDKPVDYFTAPTTAYPCAAAIDYNTADGYRKYSVLSNVEISGGKLVGVDVYWAAPANGVANKLPNKFDPWTYSYMVKVPAGTSSITITPTAMSNKITSMKINGTVVAQGSSTAVAASVGSTITIVIVAPDGVTSSTYNFTVAQA